MDYLLVEEEKGYREFPIVEGKAVGFSDEFLPDQEGFCWKQTKEGLRSYLVNGKARYFKRTGRIFIGLNGDIRVDGMKEEILLDEREIYIGNCERFWYCGREIVLPQGEWKKELHGGEEFLIGKLCLLVVKDYFILRAPENDIYSNLPFLESLGKQQEDFPHYRRSPRLIKRVPEDKIVLEKEPEMEQTPKGSLIQLILPPLIMLIITIVISFFLKRGLYIIISITATIMGMITSVIRYFSDRKERRERNKKRKENYENYLLGKRKELDRLRKKEEDAYAYNFLLPKQIEEMTAAYSSRIYERNLMDEDFLQIKLGEMKGPSSYSVQINIDELALEKGEFDREIRDLKQEFGYLEKKPVSIDLKRAHLGLVGDKRNIHEQLKLIITQLSFYHSYHDMQFVMILDKKYDWEFEWMKWLPHTRISAINAYGYINSEKMRDQVLGSLHQILKERRQKQEENKKESRFVPHYVFIIDEPRLIMDHAIMEYLDKSDEELGLSVIYTTYQKANLPENIKTVLQINNYEQGILLLEQGVMKEDKLTLLHTEDIDFEQIARNLSVLIHEQGVISQIPENITFFEMYGVRHPEELHAAIRWESNESHKTLAVPLGVRSKDDIVSLNLHEKAHGPHGLIAGTTGSGKSEIIQSYILSLAVNFHPYEVGFLLIDYKGGGMSGLFSELPHLLGTITNLDGNESLRAMASIKSELERRQRIFSHYNVNHINAYNKLYKLGKAEEPIPHLFLISDEFAELKKEQPGFMDELISTARIGRSLGVHLILATQKPSGVVNDQIWTNSRFKLALKVQNEADSKEIIKTGDAAFITQPGRAYLQVGNNEIYELFQSAWSGATYSEEHVEVRDDRVYIINELGQGDLVNGDLSESGEQIQVKDTQLDVTVRYLAEEFKASGMEPVARPWLPPLAAELISPCSDLWEEIKAAGKTVSEEVDMEVPLCRVDIPEEQSQEEYSINLSEGGNFAYFASSGYGKSTVLTTVLLSLAIKNRVDQVHFYIIDFGNNALMPLNILPHTADYITFDDDEKLDKFFHILSEEMKRRKKLLAERMVQNFSVYNQCSETPLHAIVVAVDNFDVVKEKGFEAEEFFTKLSRDGSGLGIYLVLSATRSSSVRYATLNNFRNKIAGYLYEETDITAIAGKSTYRLPEQKGRAMVKMETTNICQMYVMASCRSQVSYNQDIRALAESIRDFYPGQSAPRIPVLPDIFTENMFADFKAESQWQILLGLELANVTLQGIAFGQSPFLIIGESGRGKTNILKVIMNQAKERGIVHLFDNREMDFYASRDEAGIDYVEPERIADFADEITEESRRRQEAYKEALSENPRLNRREYMAGMEQEYILIDDGELFIENVSEIIKKQPAFLKEAAESGILVVFAIQPAKFKGFDELSKWLKGSSNGLLLSGQGSLNVFPVTSMKEYPVMGDGLLFSDGSYVKIRLPKAEDEVKP